MENLQELGLRYIRNRLNENSSIGFKDNFMSFYYDGSGQRLHYILPHYVARILLKNQYVIKRRLAFINEEDKGKEDAILCTIDLNKCKVVSIHGNSVEFENFFLYLNSSKDENNPLNEQYKILRDEL